MLCAAGMKMSYIQVWSLDGSPLKNATPGVEEKPSNSRRLIGHSGPVYALSFSPSTEKPYADSPPTHSRLLLSSSADKTIRLWSIDGWHCLCVFRAHDAPVWDVKWSPFGHYFLSCGHDKVARVWSQEHISPVRMFVGHDSDVDTGCWHPNGAYIFTSGDKTVRMWDIMRGTAVRMFSGHTGNITAIDCSPDGKTIASADDQGSIFLWDLASGHAIKRMRGHGRGGIWSLSWSVESTVIVSGGADNTVRVWDVSQRADHKASSDVSKVEGAMAAPSAPIGVTQKKTKRDVVVTPDQLSVFPTKKSPVYKVMFSRSNLVLSGSAYMPEPA
jgi:transcription initiation factor TFIID subunit 5